MRKTYIMGIVSFLILILFPFVFEDSMKGGDHAKVLGTSVVIMFFIGTGTYIITDKKEGKRKVTLDTASWISTLIMILFVCLYFVNIKDKDFYFIFLLSATSLSVVVFVLEIIIRKIFKKPPR